MARLWHFTSKFELGNLYVVVEGDVVSKVFFGRLSQVAPKRRETLKGVLMGKPVGKLEDLLGGWSLTDMWDDLQITLDEQIKL
jgi:hypothetical protein